MFNVDLPWNPAVLEQRIARAHRMDQKQPVQVFVLVTEGTLEEKLLGTIAAKKDLALAALDMESDVDAVDVASGMDELKRRLDSCWEHAAKRRWTNRCCLASRQQPDSRIPRVASATRRPEGNCWGRRSSCSAN